MSADNGIYVAKFKNGWKVIHSQCVDGNIFYYRENTKARKKVIKTYFKDAKLLKTLEEKNNEIDKLYNEIMDDDFPILEHGTVDLGELEDYE